MEAKCHQYLSDRKSPCRTVRGLPAREARLWKYFSAAGSATIAAVRQVTSPSVARMPKLTNAWLLASISEPNPMIVVSEQSATAPPLCSMAAMIDRDRSER